MLDIYTQVSATKDCDYPEEGTVGIIIEVDSPVLASTQSMPYRVAFWLEDSQRFVRIWVGEHEIQQDTRKISVKEV